MVLENFAGAGTAFMVLCKPYAYLATKCGMKGGKYLETSGCEVRFTVLHSRDGAHAKKSRRG
jgi:hypothetical protein